MSSRYNIWLQLADASEPIGFKADTPVMIFGLDEVNLSQLGEISAEFPGEFKVYHGDGWVHATLVLHKYVKAMITFQTATLPSEKATPEIETQLNRVLNNPGVISLLEAAGLSDVSVKVKLF